MLASPLASHSNSTQPPRRLPASRASPPCPPAPLPSGSLLPTPYTFTLPLHPPTSPRPAPLHVPPLHSHSGQSTPIPTPLPLHSTPLPGPPGSPASPPHVPDSRSDSVPTILCSALGTHLSTPNAQRSTLNAPYSTLTSRMSRVNGHISIPRPYTLFPRILSSALPPRKQSTAFLPLSPTIIPVGVFPSHLRPFIRKTGASSPLPSRARSLILLQLR